MSWVIANVTALFEPGSTKTSVSPISPPMARVSIAAGPTEDPEITRIHLIAQGDEGQALYILQHGELQVRARTDAGNETVFTTIVRIDTPVEVDYYRNGGVLQTVLRRILRDSAGG